MYVGMGIISNIKIWSGLSMKFKNKSSCSLLLSSGTNPSTLSIKNKENNVFE